MKSFNISADSVHYRLASTYGPASKYQISIGTVDLCQYVRATFFGFLVACTVACVAGAAIGMTLGDFGAWVVASINAGYLVDMEAGSIMFTTFVTVGAAMALLYGAIKWIVDYQGRRDEIRMNAPPKPYVEPGFAKAAYLQFKGKYCGRISVSDE